MNEKEQLQYNRRVTKWLLVGLTTIGGGVYTITQDIRMTVGVVIIVVGIFITIGAAEIGKK